MRSRLVYLLILALAVSLTGCTPSQPPSAGHTSLNIGVMPDVESIPFIIAEHNGYFQKQGVEVNLIHFKSAQDRDSAMQSGQLDGMITDIVAVVFANEGGFNQKIIARNDGNIEMLAGADTGINSLAGLKGKRVGLSTNTIMEYSVDTILQSGQIQPEDVQKVAIPPLPTRLEMLVEGRIDACILPEPLAGLAVKNGARVLSSTDELANKAGAIAFTEKSLTEHPEAIKAVFRAYNDSVAYLAQEAKESYLDFVIEAQSFPVAISESLVLPKYSEAVRPDEKIVADVVEWMKAKDLVSGEYKYEDLVDESILG